MDDTPMLIWDWDMQVPYPLAVDDEYLTKAGSFPQPEGKTSALAGFHYVSRIFHVLGVVLSSLRAHRTARHGETTAVGNLLSLPAYAPSSHFLQALDCILADLPPELQLRVEPPRSTGPNASSDPGEERGQRRGDTMAFDICRVNIAITQAMTRQLIKQYALALCEEDAALHPSPRRLIIEMLDAMPTESLTANGDSLVRSGHGGRLTSADEGALLRPLRYARFGRYGRRRGPVQLRVPLHGKYLLCFQIGGEG